MSTVSEIRAALVEACRRHSRVAHEVEDAAHDLVVSALGRDFTLDGFLSSAHGAARRHAAFLARSSARRRAREAAVAAVARAEEHGTDPELAERSPLAALSPALRTTLLLLFAGLDKAELRSALGLTDTALRKRFQALRKIGPFARAELPIARRAAPAQLRRSQVSLLPRLASALGRGGVAGRVLSASDPDGHALIFRESLTARGVTATPEAPLRGAHSLGGTSC